MDTIVGMMWNKNEGDILAHTIADAVGKVDSLFIADDGSTDNSWDIILSAQKSFKNIEYIQQAPNKNDPGQRTVLLNEIRRRYKPENTWVQVIESDIMVLDTEVRTAIIDHAVDDLGVTWQLLNAARKSGEWDAWDTYPNWNVSIKEVMPYAHWIEHMLYTFRPLPGLYYDQDTWRPWPKGFANYVKNPPLKRNKKSPNSPLLAHYGYRGPTHFKCKYGNKHFNKYPSWDLTSVQTIKDTVYFFNGMWNNSLLVPMSRDGWRESRG